MGGNGWCCWECNSTEHRVKDCPDRKCYCCGKKGHLKEECQYKKKHGSVCFNCKKPNHKKFQCRKEGGGAFRPVQTGGGHRVGGGMGLTFSMMLEEEVVKEEQKLFDKEVELAGLDDEGKEGGARAAFSSKEEVDIDQSLQRRESLSSGSSSFDSSNFSISSVLDGRETISSNSSLVEDSTISVIMQVMGESIFEEEGGGEVECWGECKARFMTKMP